MRFLAAEGTEKRNTNDGKPPTILTCTIHTTFFYTAVDLFGPIKVKVGRNKTNKYWGVLFTCLNVRAVYIDVATDYSTPGILPVLRTFFCIRGYPRCLWSDRGSHLVGAEVELRKAIEGRDTTELKDFLHEKGMKWKFVAPTAAHHNGCAESLIRVTKAALKKSIGDEVLTPLECQTVLFETANLLNQRPIGRIPNAPADGTYLCPNDIVLGRASTNTPKALSERRKIHAIDMNFVSGS